MSTICDLQYFAGKANELYLLRDRVAELEELLGLGRNITPEIVRLGFSPSEAAVLGVLLQRNGFARPEFIWSALYGSTRDCDQPDIKIIDVWLSKIRKKLRESGAAISIETVLHHGWQLTEKSKTELRHAMKAGQLSNTQPEK